MESDVNPRYRHLVDLEGRLQPLGRTPVSIRVRNLSLAYRLIPGQVGVLRLEVAGESLHLPGCVAWSRPVGVPLPEATGPCRSGLRFDVLPHETESRLRQFLTSLLPLAVTASRA